MDDSQYKIDAALNDLRISLLENENKVLKDKIFELENTISLEGNLELYEKVKILTEENNLLKKRNDNLSKNFNIILEENNLLKELLESCIPQLKLHEKELSRYKTRKKKPKKKKYYISDLIKLKKEGKTYKEIAEMYGVSPSTIHYRIHKVDKSISEIGT